MGVKAIVGRVSRANKIRIFRLMVRETHPTGTFDEAKLPFYRKEMISRINLANLLINLISAVTQQMLEWPCFADGSGTK